MGKAESRWLPVLGWEDLYEVSDRGEVRSIQRRKGTPGGLLLKTPPDNRGYPQLNLTRGGVHTHVHLHRLVAMAFLGPCPPGMECRHLDGNRANAVVENLAWGTPSENNYDRVRHGTFVNMNMSKTHCHYGHEFTPENTTIVQRTNRPGQIYRQCRTCRRRRNKEQAARRKAARARRLG